jgi:hypothetical protein
MQQILSDKKCSLVGTRFAAVCRVSEGAHTRAAMAATGSDGVVIT